MMIGQPDYTLYMLIGGAFIGVMFILWKMGVFKGKDKNAPISREKSDFKKAWEELELNDNSISENIDSDLLSYHYKSLWKGKKPIGSIKFIKREEKDSKEFFLIGYVKAWFTIGKAIFPKIFGDNKGIIRVGGNTFSKYKTSHELVIHSGIAIDGLRFYNYTDTDMKLQKAMIEDEMWKKEYENAGDIIFAQAQNLATAVPVFAHQQAIEETKLQQEKAKREAKISP
jgi:hypothetical protein